MGHFTRFLWLTIALVTLHTPLTAQTPPKIEWEVANRFAPFETQSGHTTPVDLFEAYKLNPGQSFEDWHRDMAANGPVTSPYRSALTTGKDAELMHWNQRFFTHHDRILNLVRNEDDPNTTITARLWLDTDGDCTWTLKEATEPEPCREPTLIDLPLAGAEVSVTWDGGSSKDMLEPDHVVIVAMGDSYGSGEGNPDVPAQWKAGQSLPGNNNLSWLLDYDRLDTPAEDFDSPSKNWVDDNCHRSFFSHQSLTALRLASDNPHSFVSFLHYACTGAEIFDGILVPQYQAWGKGIYIPYSQMNFAIRDLCKVLPEPYEKVTDQELDGINIRAFHRRGGKDNVPGRASNLAPDADNFSRSTKSLRQKNDGAFPQSGLLTCPEGQLVKPDHLFLSIGGNDIGFADIVTYYVVPPQWKVNAVGNFLFPDVCPAPQYRVSKKLKQLTRYCNNLDQKISYHAGDLITGHANSLGMTDRYKLLLNILNHRLGVSPQDVIIPQYPDPMRTKASTAPACAALTPSDYDIPGDAPFVFRPDSQWNALKATAGKGVLNALGDNIKKWQFNMTAGEGINAVKQFDEFRQVLAKTADETGMQLVCETRDAFAGYNWQKGSHSNLANTKPYWHPSSWDPYAFEEDTRAVRTGNDSFMTQPGDKGLTGTIHPNLVGHRLVAEMVYQKIWGDGAQ